MKYYIVNYMDRPHADLVAGEIDGKLYYLMRDIKEEKKHFDGMLVSQNQVTNVEEFGLKVTEGKHCVHFEAQRASQAKYSSGETRDWQGDWEFILPRLFKWDIVNESKD